MDFEPFFKVHNSVSVHPKSIIFGQITKLNMIFHVVVSVIDYLKFETRHSSPMNCRSPFTENICTILNARAMAKKT